jgi:hypothetical protein
MDAGCRRHVNRIKPLLGEGIKLNLNSFQKMIRLVSILLVTIPYPVPALGESGYMVENCDESSGFYYESKGQVNLYDTEWQVVVYVDLKEINNQSHEIEMYIKHINHLCQEIAVQNWTDCYHFSDIGRERLLQIKRTENLIVDISDP